MGGACDLRHGWQTLCTELAGAYRKAGKWILITIPLLVPSTYTWVKAEDSLIIFGFPSSKAKKEYQAYSRFCTSKPEKGWRPQLDQHNALDPEP